MKIVYNKNRFITAIGLMVNKWYDVFKIFN